MGMTDSKETKGHPKGKKEKTPMVKDSPTVPHHHLPTWHACSPFGFPYMERNDGLSELCPITLYLVHIWCFLFALKNTKTFHSMGNIQPGHPTQPGPIWYFLVQEHE